MVVGLGRVEAKDLYNTRRAIFGMQCKGMVAREIPAIASSPFPLSKFCGKASSDQNFSACTCGAWFNSFVMAYVSSPIFLSFFES